MYLIEVSEHYLTTDSKTVECYSCLDSIRYTRISELGGVGSAGFYESQDSI